jgi:hypothetical protein
MYNIECTNVIYNHYNYMFRPPGLSSGWAEDFKLNYTLVVALALFVGGGRGRGGGNEISSIISYTGCPRRNGPKFGRVFLRSNYTDITQNTYIQSSMFTEILAREV